MLTRNWTEKIDGLTKDLRVSERWIGHFCYGGHFVCLKRNPLRAGVAFGKERIIWRFSLLHSFCRGLPTPPPPQVPSSAGQSKSVVTLMEKRLERFEKLLKAKKKPNRKKGATKLWETRCVHVCVCVCMWKRERVRKKREREGEQ